MVWKRHAVKYPGEVQDRTCGTNRLADRKQCALSTEAKWMGWGFGWVDKAHCFRSARWFGAAGLIPDFSRVFHGMALLDLCLETFFPCAILSYPGQPPSSKKPTVSSCFEERKISEPGWDVLSVRLRSYRACSCQIGLFTYFQNWLF